MPCGNTSLPGPADPSATTGLELDRHTTWRLYVKQASGEPGSRTLVGEVWCREKVKTTSHPKGQLSGCKQAAHS